jgi:hypothetical protein
VEAPRCGSATTLARAQADTRNLLLALRSHMGRALQEMQDMDSAVKSFDAAPFKYLRHAEVWLPQLANRTYLDMEQE